MKLHSRIALALVAATGSGSCMAIDPPMAPPRQTQDLIAKDNAVFLPSVRISVSPDEASAPLALEAGYYGGRGTASQGIRAGELPVIFGNQVFAGPQTVDYAFDFRHAEILIRGGRYFGPERRFSLEVLGGLAYGELRLTAVGATQSTSEQIVGAGYVVGGAAAWNITQATSLQARLVLGDFGWSSSSGITESNRIEVDFAHRFGRHLALRAGYAYWQIDAERELKDRATVKSPVRVTSRGPALSLEVMF